MSSFSDMLTYLRKREGYSQQELSEKLSVSRSAISMYEAGKREPDYATLEEIADFFNVNMSTLLGKTENEKIMPTLSGEATKQEQPVLSEKRQAALEIIEKLSDAQIDAILKLLGE